MKKEQQKLKLARTGAKVAAVAIKTEAKVLSKVAKGAGSLIKSAHARHADKRAAKKAAKKAEASA
jgi:hypothetical protein